MRAGVRVELLPSHLPSHYPHTSGTGKYTVRVLLQNLTKVPEKYSCLVPTVQHRYTNSIAMLHYQYNYAAPSVYLCCTFGARGLHFYRHYYSKVFTVAFLAAKPFDFHLILIVPWQNKGDLSRIFLLIMSAY